MVTQVKTEVIPEGRSVATGDTNTLWASDNVLFIDLVIGSFEEWGVSGFGNLLTISFVYLSACMLIFNLTKKGHKHKI